MTQQQQPEEVKENENEAIMACPSFQNKFLADEEEKPQLPAVEIELDDFEFAFVSQQPDTSTAYPIFNRDFFLFHDDEARTHGGGENGAEQVKLEFQKLAIEEERDLRQSTSRSSSCSCSSDELDTTPAESYCIWRPPPASQDMRKKSNSTGGSRRWRLRDLVVGRSHSDGKEKFVFLSSPAPPPPPPPAAIQEKRSSGTKPQKVEGKKVRGGVKVSEMDMATAHRLYYAKGGAAGAGDRRQSYLPYRKDLVGFFGGVNGGNRGFQPF